MQLTAWQHIFTTVEKDRSPAGRRGYQTLFYSREGLNEADLRTLETRSQYYSAPGDPVKFQFYWLPGDRWVVSQSVALAERDEFGRKGRYLTHSLICTMEAWQQLACAPFAVWTVKPFIRRLDQAFAQGDAKNGNTPPITLRLEADWQDGALAVARQWTPEALRELARLAWGAAALQTSGKYVGMSGTVTEIGRVLLASYILTPPDERRFLTFDTHATGCNWGSQDMFWAQGFPAGERIQSSLVVDAATYRVQADALPVEPSRPYTRWMEEIVIPGRLDSLLAEQDWALALESVIRGQPVERRLLAGVNPQFARRFADLSADELGKRMQSLLLPGLPLRLRQPLLLQIGRTPYDQLRQLVQGLTRQDMIGMAYEALLTEATPPSSAERKALATFADEHAGMRGLLCLWSGDLEGWRKQLDAINNQEYAKVVAKLMQRGAVPSWKLISSRHIDDWFYHAIVHTRSNELVDVARALGECGGPAAVDYLAGYVPQLKPAEQRQIYKWLKKSYRDEAAALWRALELALGKSDSSKGGLRGLLFGSKEE